MHANPKCTRHSTHIKFHILLQIVYFKIISLFWELLQYMLQVNFTKFISIQFNSTQFNFTMRLAIESS